MKIRVFAAFTLLLVAGLAGAPIAQEAGYPMILIPTAKGPFTFADG